MCFGENCCRRLQYGTCMILGICLLQVPPKHSFRYIKILGVSPQVQIYWNELYACLLKCKSRIASYGNNADALYILRLRYVIFTLS